MFDLCQSLPSISGYVPVSVGPLSSQYGNLLYETDQEGVSTGPLWFALSVLAAEMLSLINSMCRYFSCICPDMNTNTFCIYHRDQMQSVSTRNVLGKSLKVSQ